MHHKNVDPFQKSISAIVTRVRMELLVIPFLTGIHALVHWDLMGPTVKSVSKISKRWMCKR